jgi:hypothetical protein
VSNWPPAEKGTTSVNGPRESGAAAWPASGHPAVLAIIPASQLRRWMRGVMFVSTPPCCGNDSVEGRGSRSDSAGVNCHNGAE